jgi:hypothetical protein
MLHRLAFGRHRGIAIASVPTEYLRWLIGSRNQFSSTRGIPRNASSDAARWLPNGRETDFDEATPLSASVAYIG